MSRRPVRHRVLKCLPRRPPSCLRKKATFAYCGLVAEVACPVQVQSALREARSPRRQRTAVEGAILQPRGEVKSLQQGFRRHTRGQRRSTRRSTVSRWRILLNSWYGACPSTRSPAILRICFDRDLATSRRLCPVRLVSTWNTCWCASTMTAKTSEMKSYSTCGWNRFRTCCLTNTRRGRRHDSGALSRSGSICTLSGAVSYPGTSMDPQPGV